MFKTELENRQHELRRDVYGRLKSAACRAVQILENLMDTEDTPPAVRLSAARCLLERYQSAIETEELEARINDIENILKEGSK